MAAIVMLHIRLGHCLFMHDKRNQDYWQSELLVLRDYRDDREVCHQVSSAQLKPFLKF